MRPLPGRIAAALLAVLPFLLPLSARASVPDGLYTTVAPERGLPTPVGYNSFDRSGFTLVIGRGWRLAQPVLPLDMSWLKPWLEGPGLVVRIRGVAGDTPADAAARMNRLPGVLDTAPFHTAGGLKGLRVLYGPRGKRGSFTVTRAAYLFANRPGFIYAFVAEPWPRNSGRPLLWKTGDPAKAVLPCDALLKSAALERERVGQRDN